MNEQVTRSSANVGFRTPLDCFTLCNGRINTSFRKIIAEGGKFYPASGKSQASEDLPCDVRHHGDMHTGEVDFGTVCALI